ncbi:MAG: hypothetical protein JXP34_18460 [Planctomycetes bacterium]|nr:hypothetical protein [Planctomycetota bacterium]
MFATLGVICAAALDPALAEAMASNAPSGNNPQDAGTGIDRGRSWGLEGGAVEIEIPKDRPARAVALVFSVSSFRPLPDFDARKLALDVRDRNDVGWRRLDGEWRVDESLRYRRSLAAGAGDVILWAPLGDASCEAVRISGLPERSRMRLSDVLPLRSVPSTPAPEPRADSRRETVLGVPEQRELPAERIRAIAAYDGDLLGEEILARGEPSFGDVSRIAYSFPGTAALGLPRAKEEAGILWNGTIVVPGRASDGRRVPRLIAPLLGEPLVPWGVERSVRRKLATDPPLRVTVEASFDSLAAREVAFVAPGSTTDGDLHVRFAIENPSGASERVRFGIATVIREFGRAPWEPEDPAVPLLAEDPRLAQGTGIVSAGGRAILRVRGTVGFVANGTESVLSCEREIAAGERVEIDVAIPLGEAGPEALAAAPTFDEALARARDVWSDVFVRAARMDLPESRIEGLYRASLAQLLIAADGDVIPYGMFPSIYDREVLGVEEIWEMEALASFGFGREAIDLIRGTYFTAGHLNKRTKHHQYRNGLTASSAWRLFEITRDERLLADAPDVLLPLSAWTREKRRTAGDGSAPGAPLRAGLLPRHLYGGDIEEPCHSLYGNFTCWRGLRDTGLLLAEAERRDEAKDLLEEAAAYRARILDVCAAIARRDADPPFLPFRLEETADEPTSKEYYQLFGPLALETGCLPRGGDLANLVIGAIEKGPRLIARQARFGEPAGLDALYTRGLSVEWLRGERRRDFLLGFYAQQAFAFDRDVLTSPEVMPIFFTRTQRREEELRRLDGRRRTDPCAAGPATFLLSLRDMLVLEERDEDDLPTGRLIIGAGIPSAWLRDGARILAGPIATAFGPVTISIEVGRGAHGRTAVEIPAGRGPRAIVLRLPGREDRIATAPGTRADMEF